MKEIVNYGVLGAVIFYLMFLNHCNQDNRAPPEPRGRDTTIVMDTTPPPPVIVYLPNQAPPPPMVIYIDSNARQVPKTEAAAVANLYQDSIDDQNLTLYYSSTIDGKLLGQDLSYKLKVPLAITKTVTITEPYPVPAAQLLLKSAVGFNQNGVKTWSMGLQVVSRKGLSIGYNYGLLENRHEVSLGVPIWREKR